MNHTIPKQMQAVIVQNPGKQSRLVWQDVATPWPAAGQLLVKVAAAGINRADLMQRQGLYPAPAGDSPILGLEAAGTVVAVGDDSLNCFLGKPCFGLVNGGAYADYVTMPATQAMLVPPGWSMVQAAAIAETFLTAYQLLFFIGEAQEGQRVLLHAGASGVGTSAIQLAKLKGLQVAVTVGSEEKAAACRALGCDIAINYHAEHFSERLSQLWSAGFDLILDPVAGSYMKDNLKLLAQDGKIVVYGLMGGRMLPELDLSVLFKKRGQLICSTLRNRDLEYKAKLTTAFQHDFLAALITEQLAPVIFKQYAKTEIEDAHTILGNNQTIGKLVINLAT
jgi:putative PIG3 family NAD(P)H quinone oxidoreductase